ncbi:YheC/YheD family protein [Paenibacillus sp. NEAU-GSW1]|uniref:YheC/YheD family protein n=1 Tax=Paenibacillus sp. NEAU-GSW1 TaxID=2682486 RepID=UPI0020A624D1|nr:YheC/YheD family protein [Paenibacillus sp. NEAU-GSW1]
MSIQRVTSKWAKTNALLKSQHLLEYIPETQNYSRETLFIMLENYKMVYVKPNNGTYGKGVIRVEKLAEPEIGFKYQHGTLIRSFLTFDQLFRSLNVYTSKRRYLVQRGIHLLMHQERRFDIRVMVQKNLSRAWEVTGIIGRLSHPAKIVTNYHSGGTPMSFERLMSSHMAPIEQQQYTARLHALGLLIVRSLQATYPRIKEIGIDIAIDTDFHPWILEVNTCPDPFIFRKLPNKAVFRKIYRYAVAYGRLRPRQPVVTRKRKTVAVSKPIRRKTRS